MGRFASNRKPMLVHIRYAVEFVVASAYRNIVLQVVDIIISINSAFGRKASAEASA